MAMLLDDGDGSSTETESEREFCDELEEGDEQEESQQQQQQIERPAAALDDVPLPETANTLVTAQPVKGETNELRGAELAPPVTVVEVEAARVPTPPPPADRLAAAAPAPVLAASHQPVALKSEIVDGVPSMTSGVSATTSMSAAAPLPAPQPLTQPQPHAVSAPSPVVRMPIPLGGSNFVSPFAALAMPLRPPPARDVASKAFRYFPPPPMGVTSSAPASHLPKAPPALVSATSTTPYTPHRPPPIFGAPPTSYVPQPVHARPWQLSQPPPRHPPASFPAPAILAPAQLSSLDEIPAPDEISAPAPTCDSSGVRPRPMLYDLCVLCKIKLYLPTASSGGTMQCQCCLRVLSLSAFSNSQRSKETRLRRCTECVPGGAAPLVTIQQRSPEEFARLQQPTKEPSTQELRQANRASVALRKERKAAKKTRVTRSKNINSSTKEGHSFLADGPLTATQRKSTSGITRLSDDPTRWKMEIDVRNIKLMRRSIRRRRDANDLRGSTRIAYEEQLKQEEGELNKKEARLRLENPTLFDEISSGMKVVAAKVPRDERDDAGRKKAKSPMKCKAKVVKPPTASKKRKRQSELQPGEVYEPIVSKRLRSNHGGDSDSSDTPKRVIMTRSKDRSSTWPTATSASLSATSSRAASRQPPVIIDLLSDDDE